MNLASTYFMGRVSAVDLLAWPIVVAIVATSPRRMIDLYAVFALAMVAILIGFIVLRVRRVMLAVVVIIKTTTGVVLPITTVRSRSSSITTGSVHSALSGHLHGYDVGNTAKAAAGTVLDTTCTRPAILARQWPGYASLFDEATTGQTDAERPATIVLQDWTSAGSLQAEDIADEQDLENLIPDWSSDSDGASLYTAYSHL